MNWSDYLKFLKKKRQELLQAECSKWKYIMDSCTKYELENPEEITGTRIERIAKGSGMPASEVRDLLKQYKQSKKMVKMMKGGNMDKMMKRMGAKMPKM